MKKLFRGYYKLDDDEFTRLWTKAVFIFDTNVLLNLYRYQPSTRDSLFKVIDKLKDRVWIPYHVGLEFQRNRLGVIADQSNKFGEVKKIVHEAVAQLETKLNALQLEKRHTHISPHNLLTDFKQIEEKHVQQLEKMEKESIDVSSKDEIRDQIDTLFHDKIGSKPKDQGTVDKIYAEGDERYKSNIPPGFNDIKKDDKDAESFSYDGVLYRAKYGDLIIWKQIIEYSKQQKHKDVIYITDDGKSDWWLKVRGKTIGVRPELTAEILHQAEVERFHVYNTETFLEQAKLNLDVNVTEAELIDVRQVADEINLKADAEILTLLSRASDRAVYSWLRERYDDIAIIRFGYPDFATSSEETNIGFVSKFLSNGQLSMVAIDQDITKASEALNNNTWSEITILYITPVYPDKRFLNSIESRLTSHGTARLKVIVCTCDITNELNITNVRASFYFDSTASEQPDSALPKKI